MKFGCVSNQVQSAYDLNSSLPQYLWVEATESRDQSLSSMLMSVLAGKLNRLLVLPKWAGLSPDTLDMSSNTSQVLGILCFGKSIEFQWDLFRHSLQVQEIPYLGNCFGFSTVFISTGAGNSLFRQIH